MQLHQDLAIAFYFPLMKTEQTRSGSGMLITQAFFTLITSAIALSPLTNILVSLQKSRFLHNAKKENSAYFSEQHM